jgi:hypothetical protein
MEKIQIRGQGSRMKKILIQDLGNWMEKIRIRDKHPGSAKLEISSPNLLGLNEKSSLLKKWKICRVSRIKYV